jgi:hypothetical protein
MKSSVMFRLSLDKTFADKTDKGEPMAANFKAIANDVCHILQNIFKGADLTDHRPITCYVSSESVPRIDATTDPKKIRIGLALPKESLEGLDYTRFVYQLGHELGHMMLGPLRTNGLIETLADAISYEILDRMTYLWKMKYKPSHPWHLYAPEFKKYRENTEHQLISDLPQEIKDAILLSSWSEIALYLKDQMSVLDTNITSENGLMLRSLGARILRTNKMQWKELVGISGFTNPSPTLDSKFREDLQINVADLSDSLREALTHIGR